MSDTAVTMHDIVKTYRETGRCANDHVDLTVGRGEILCLAGENGAGKTTLMKVLYGMEKPESGTITVMGKRVKIDSPLDANRLGIGMVHQHFMLVDEYTVAQNVILGREPMHNRFTIDADAAKRLVDEVIHAHGFSIDPSARVGSLTVGQKQQVEIVKMLYRDVDILILDEPTAVLTEQETASLFGTLRTLRDTGKSLILITHKLHEIKAISDRVAIMRQGRMVGHYETASVDERELAGLMMGKSFSPAIGKTPYGRKQETVLRFAQVSVVRRNQGRPMLKDVSFVARTGEILGFAGVGGNGLGELESVLAGTLPISGGTITHRGQDISKSDAHRLRERGLAYVPSDRLKVGSALEASVSENLIIAARKRFSRHGMMRGKHIMQHARTLIDTYSVQGTADMPIGTLSGGNIQKVILAREIAQYRDYIVFSEPTWGLDIASSKFVHTQMIALRDAGASVLLLSSNLDEILSLSDRVLIFSRGSIVAELEGERLHTVTKEEMGAYMLGMHVREAAHE